ncbi:prenyltransferase/squalene oxidase repeat-containing protein [Carnobacterium divergens]|uniref:prenyltransferase/squalene oxidase repeat-containing protein n=1 Tax=Carnobacterium divergens TaxID=2748 RepID=UPI0007F410A8|nr:prenyltransferase/squalene oxidase repeat-containing protein [Carnobacterium divergens]SBO17642.1 Geranylgeranyl transferase type II beta subunit [Carnobacterium divergens]
MTTKIFSNELEKIVLNEFMDEKNGGLFASINTDKTDIVTEDKLLLDVSLAILAFTQQKNYLALEKCILALEKFKDPNNIGYFEILDTISLPYEVGKIKTTFTQLLTGYSLYTAGQVTDNENLQTKGNELIEKVSDTYFKYNHATRFTEEWSSILSEEKKLSDASLFIYVLNTLNIDKYQTKSSSLTKLLMNFLDGQRGAFSVLNINNQPIESKGKTLADMSLLIFSLSTILDQDNSYVEIIDQTIQFIIDNYSHPFTKGYWNKSDSFGIVSVDSIPVYYNHAESPFPIKSTQSHALFLLALKKYKINTKNSQYDPIIKELLTQLSIYFNDKNGGLMLGQGNWFSTPTNPTVPLARHTMVPPFTVGSFVVGNNRYLPLHQKTATLQLIGILALENETIQDNEELPHLPYTKIDFNTDKTYVSTEKLTDSYINEDTYLAWSKKTVSGFAFGLTPYKSPLGFKSDRTPQNFSALHVVADMKVLNRTIQNQENLQIILRSSQNSDGGFGEQPSLLSELFTTYCVVFTNYILGSYDFDVKKCIEFIQNCQNTDGGFGNAPGYPSDVWHSNFGTLLLHILDDEPKDKEALIQYLLNAQNADGGFGVIPNGVSETFSTFRAVDSLLISGVDIPNKEKTIQWLKKLQDSNGGFKYQENKIVSFVGSYHAIGALYLLNELPDDVEQAKKWIASHQSPDGGFSRAENNPSDTTDEGFIAIHASYMLERKINPYWVAIIT